jgi:putative ABC transport system ATP-binding protein
VDATDIAETPQRFVLSAEKLGRQVDGKVLVDAVTVGVSAGQTLAIVGPSGSGKSSFLRLLNRLDEATEGTVFLEGIDYRQIPPRELRRRVGMVTQRAFLFPGSVADNLRFGPAQQGETLPRGAIEDLLGKVGLPGYADRGVANLSGGEAQRVSIARALANQPRVLLLDEPTSALDQQAKMGVEALIQEIIRQNKLTCIVVTHDMEQAVRIADRVMLMESGRVRKIGTVQEVLRAASDL